MFEEVLKMGLEVCGTVGTGCSPYFRKTISLVAPGKYHISSHVQRKMEAIRLSLGDVA